MITGQMPTKTKCKSMTNEQKQQVADQLRQFVASFPSQRAAAANLKGVSEALVVQVLKGNWDQISAAMWRSLGKQVGVSHRQGWQLVETRNFKTIRDYVDDAKVYGKTHAITGPSGCGKTATAEWCTRHMANVFHLECAEYWNKKQFLSELLSKMGKESSGLTIGDMMELVVSSLLRMDEPVIVLDEADKLNDGVLYFFITIYNKTRNSCGLVLMATDHLAKRIKRGLQLNRKGYAEIYSRIARKYQECIVPRAGEMKAICQANGLDGEMAINQIVNEAEGDLRRVERAVHKYKRLAAIANPKTEAA